jgi:hypothetical protein
MAIESFPLTPGFSRVIHALRDQNCFSSFDRAEKPLKRLTKGTHAPITSLKRGVNENGTSSA